MSKSGRIRALLSSGKSTAEIAKEVGCTPALVYNVKSAMGGAKRKGRPVKSAKGGSGSMSLGSGLEGILTALRDAERQQSRQRAALERIQAVLRDALA